MNGWASGDNRLPTVLRRSLVSPAIWLRTEPDECPFYRMANSSRQSNLNTGDRSENPTIFYARLRKLGNNFARVARSCCHAWIKPHLSPYVKVSRTDKLNGKTRLASDNKRRCAIPSGDTSSQSVSLRARTLYLDPRSLQEFRTHARYYIRHVYSCLRI